MAWHIIDSVDEFDRIAGDFLRSRPVEHTVPLTLVDTLRKRGSHFYGIDDPYFGWWQDHDGGVGGAFLRTPPFPLYLTVAPASQAALDDGADHVVLFTDLANPPATPSTSGSATGRSRIAPRWSSPHE